MILDFDAQTLLTHIIEIINNVTTDEDESEPTYEAVQSEIMQAFLMHSRANEPNGLRDRFILWTAYMWPDATERSLAESREKYPDRHDA